MSMLNTYEIQFTTTSDFYKKKLLPFNEMVKQVFAEDKTQAVERGYQKLMRDFPESPKDIWKVKCVIKRSDNVLHGLFNPVNIITYKDQNQSKAMVFWKTDNPLTGR